MNRSGWPLLGIVATLMLSHVAAYNCALQEVYGNDEFGVSCGYENKQIEVAVHCNSPQRYDSWSRFPEDKLDLWNVGTMVFRECAVPETLSLRDVVHSLNISFVDSLLFEKLRSSLSRENLRGFSVRKLTIEEATFGQLPSDMLYDVSDLKDLRIQNTSLASIPANFFGDWAKSLQSVTIMYSQLQRIGRHDLSKLDKVQKLWLSGGEIAQIELGAFDELPNLRLLDISSNRLRSLPADLFRRLDSLESLHMSANRFEQLPAELLTGIENCRLQRFRMSSNDGPLTTLPDGFLRNLSALTFVQLNSNRFSSLPSDLFVGAESLEQLDISYNNLTTLPSEIFRDTRKLLKLTIQNSQLEYLPKGIFQGLTDLEKLHLDQNRLTNISEDVLQGIDNLKMLNASWNNLSYIEPQLCKYVKIIEEVDLSGNRLTLESTSGFSVFFNCVHLKRLYAAHNKVPQIYFDWSYLNFDYIDLQYNELTTFGTTHLSMFSHEIVIYLQHNKISTIDFQELEIETERFRSANVHHPSKRIKVYLGDNPLNCDCRLVDFFRYFENKMNRNVKGYVEVYADSIENTYDIGFEGFECASPRELASRSIVDIKSEDLNCLVESNTKEDACSTLCFCREYPEKHMLSVDCSNKNLTGLPTSIANLHGWAIQLNMSRNKLSQTPTLNTSLMLNATSLIVTNATGANLTFNSSYLPNIVSLDLSENNISVVTIDLFSNKLEDLKLHNNVISRLDQKVIDYLAEDKILRKLTLHGNRWECNCQARNFLGLVQKKLTQHELHEVTCYGTNRKLSALTANELCEGAITIIVVASLLIAFLGIIMGILAALYYKYHKEIKVWLYSKQWCLWFVTEDELDKDKKYDAFISFSHKDEDFVEKEIIAKLEEGPRPYKLCLHYRDWLAGEWIPVQISRSVEESRRTVVILSANFLESVWGRMEFRAAHTQALKEGRARLIVVLYGELGNMDDLDPELKSYLSLNTYVKWGDPWFWDKLRYALPHRYEHTKRKSRNARIIENHLAQVPVSNGGAAAAVNAKAEVIPMPKLITSTNDSVKLLDSGAEDERMVASC